MIAAASTINPSVQLLALLLLTTLSVLPVLTNASAASDPRRSAHSNVLRSRSEPASPVGKRGIAIPLRIRSPPTEVKRDRNGTTTAAGDNLDLLLRWKDKIGTKYGAVSGGGEASKRDTSDSVTLTDLNTDGSYSVALSIGTPAQSFLANLDTGSADFWLISSSCTLCGSSYDTYETASSSSFVKSNSSFTISYGSGTASGTLGTDAVTIGDYTVAKQTLGVVTSMTSGLVTTPNSGLMGMGFQGLAISGATPWWQTLATDGVWSDPLFGIALARYRDVAGASSTESAGGTVTLGYADSSLYSGSITYTTVTTGTNGYWNIPINSVTSQGTTVSLSASAAAIDTGTTLIGGPATDVAAIYAAISGSVALTGSLAGYYGYPCSTDITLTFTFGSFTGTVQENDFNIGTYSSDTTMCTGGVYAVTLSSSSPVQWVLGDVFLKNVYSVYRYTPAAVGFAALPGVASAASSSVSTIIPVATSLATASFGGASNATTSSAAAVSSDTASASPGFAITNSTSSQAVVTIYSTASVASSATTTGGVATVTSAVHVTADNATSSTSSSVKSIAMQGGSRLVAMLLPLAGVWLIVR